MVGLAGLLILGEEVLVRLQHGRWIMHPLSTLLRHLDPAVAAMITLSGWPAAHDVIVSLLTTVPLSLFLIGLGALAVGKGAADRYR